MVDHEQAAVHGFTVDPRTERDRSSPGCGRTGVSVLGTLPWQRGEQEERTRILTPGGASGRRGSDGRASEKGGGGGANSTTRGMGHEGGERGADLSAVKLAGGVAPFYRVAGGEVRGRRRPTAVGFELVGFNIDSGRGVVREREGGRAVVRSSSIRVRERDGRWQPTGWVVAARAGGGRWPVSLTGWAHLSVRGRQRPNRTSSEREAMGRLGRTGREEMGHGWAGKEESRSGRNYFLG
jgi:hypothetical protein